MFASSVFGKECLRNLGMCGEAVEAMSDDDNDNRRFLVDTVWSSAVELFLCSFSHSLKHWRQIKASADGSSANGSKYFLALYLFG